MRENHDRYVSSMSPPGIRPRPREGTAGARSPLLVLSGRVYLCVPKAGGRVTWFRVDDSLHDHSKVRKVAAKAPAALALWLIAGSWCSRKLTDGFIPDDDLPWLIPGAEELAAELVAARLWRRVKGGHQFHDWLQYNPSAEKVLADRAAAAERMRKLRSAEHRKGSRARATEDRAKFDHSRSSLQNFSGARPECPQHPGNAASNCGACRSERLGAS